MRRYLMEFAVAAAFSVATPGPEPVAATPTLNRQQRRHKFANARKQAGQWRRASAALSAKLDKQIAALNAIEGAP